MSNFPPTYFRPVAGVNLIRLSEEQILLKTDHRTLRLDGASATLVADRVWPLLDGRTPVAAIAGAIPVAETELRALLNQLQSHGILRSAARILEDEVIGSSPQFTNLLNGLGIDADTTQAYLAQKTVGIVGLEGIGEHLADQLYECGLRRFRLAAVPAGQSPAGDDRQSWPKRLQSGNVETQIISSEEMTRHALKKLLADCDLIVACIDKGFIAASYWINEISIEGQIPAIYGDWDGHLSIVGPLVVPGVTSCYMCYKMRRIATAEDYEEAMSYEEYLNQNKGSLYHQRAFLPPTVAMAGGLLASEVIKFLLQLNVPSLRNQILVHDSLKLTTETHPVLVKPGCPVCQKKSLTASTMGKRPSPRQT